MYNPQQYSQLFQPNAYPQQMQPNFLPQQQIMTVNGYDSIKTLKMGPNSSALIADENQPILYKCVSDSLGNVSVSIFDISPHQEQTPQQMEVSQMQAIMEEVNAGVKNMNSAIMELMAFVKEAQNSEPVTRTKSAGKS